MSYEPTEWKAGDVVTSAKLNKMEQGIATSSTGGGALVVTATFDETTGAGTLDKTWREIHDALPLAFLKTSSYFLFIDAENESEGNYACAAALYDGSVMEFVAASPDDYPTLVVEGGGEE